MKPDERGHTAATPTNKAEAVLKAEAAFAQLPSRVADVARGLVVLHWFSEDIIAALLPLNAPEPERATTVAAVTSLPFVERAPQGYVYYPLLRQGLLERYRRERPNELKAACRGAAVALVMAKESDSPIVGGAGDGDVDDATAIERAYCLVAAGEAQEAHKQIHDLVARFLERQDWAGCNDLYEATREAEALALAHPLPRVADYYLLRGMARAAQTKFAQAIKDLNMALERQPTTAWAVAMRGELNARLAHDDIALADLARAAFMDRTTVEALAGRGSLNRLVDAYIREPDAFPQAKMEGFGKLAEVLGAQGETARLQGRDAEALTYFQHALTLAPELAWAYASRGALYMNQERAEEALADTSRAIELDGKYAWAMVNRARILRSMDRDEEALAEIERALALEPKNSMAFAERGEIHRKHGRLDEAMEDLSQALRLNSLNAWAAARRGQVFKAKGEFMEALAEMHRAIALAPVEDAWAFATRGELHVYFENWDDALSDLTHAIELKPDHEQAIADRAQVLLELDNYEGAVADFTWLIERHPELTWALIQRGRAYLGQRHYNEAIADLSEALRRSPYDAETLALRGQVYSETGMYAEALADLDQAIALDPQNDLALASRAEVRLRREENPAALADLDAAIALQPEDDWNYYRRALARQALGEPAQATEDMARAVAIAQKRTEQEPKDWANALNLALYECAAGQPQEAERLYRQALAEGAPLDQIQQALADLDELVALRPRQEGAAELRGILQHDQRG